MTMSRNAVGNLIARYETVLQKCSLLNTFGTLALAGAVVLGGASGALASGYTALKSTYAITPDAYCIDVGSTAQTWATFDEGTVTLDLTGQTFSGIKDTSYGVISNIAREGTADKVSHNVIVNGGTFSDNASDAGGAMTLWTSTNMDGGAWLQHEINGTVFSGNTSTRKGGALFIAYQTSNIADTVTASVSISDAEFTGNSSADGGAIYNDSDGVTITDSTFTANEATGLGGAIYNNGGTVAITDSSFSENVGGAIYNNGGTVAITDSSFSENVGGAIYNNGGTVTVSGETTFTGNEGDGNKNALGGAITNIGGDLTVGDGVVFDGNSTTNTSGNGAGAIVSRALASSTSNATLTIGDNVQFINNTSDAVGALYIHLADNNGTSTTTSTATIGDNVLFEGNTSEGGAGAISIMNQNSKSPDSEASLKIGENATFKNNTAAMGGGALVATNTNASFTIAAGAVFEGNTDTSATTDYWYGGGAILVQSGAEGNLEGAEFINNSSTAAGGAIRVTGTETVLNFSGINIFSGNTVNGVLNDIQNDDGTINVSGEMTLDGGILGTGTTNFDAESVLTINTGTVLEGVVTEEGAQLVVTGVGNKAGEVELNISGTIVDGSWGLDAEDAESTISIDAELLKVVDITFVEDGKYVLSFEADSAAISGSLGSNAAVA